MVYYFLTDLWNGFIGVHLPVWANEYNGINVVSGPIFDFDFDGFRDHKNITDEGYGITEMIFGVKKTKV